MIDIVDHEEEKVEIPRFMERDRLHRMYLRSIEENDKALESIKQKVVHKKKPTRKKSLYTLLKHLLQR